MLRLTYCYYVNLAGLNNTTHEQRETICRLR
jgi:hypothetical protein